MTSKLSTQEVTNSIRSSKQRRYQFWYEDDKGRMQVSLTKVSRFLNQIGINLIRINDSWMYIETKDNVIREVDETYISQCLLKEVKQSDLSNFEKDKVEDALRGKNKLIIAKDQLMLLEQKEIDLKRDEEDNSYIYYQNKWIEITSSNVQSNDYALLDCNIWESQILDRSIELIEATRGELLKGCEFAQFLWNVCNQERARFDSLCSLIGYLLHQYKNPSEAIAAVFMDEKISDNPEGRTGKGIVMNALGYMREMATQDGKNFKFGGRYTYQNVKLSTSILTFDDVRENFDFDKLFSVITDGMDVDRRWAHQLRIEKENSPKVLIITNFVIKGNGSSHIGRRKEFEFSPHYNLDHKPIDEFGHNFFIDWDDEQWNLFDNFMIRCIQSFLESGIIDVKSINIERKRIESETCPEFVEFIKSYQTNKPHDRKRAMDLFEQSYLEVSREKWYTNRQFIKWLEIYARHKGYEYSSKRLTGGGSTFKFDDPTSYTEEIKKKPESIKEKVEAHKKNGASKSDDKIFTTPTRVAKLMDSID